MAFQFISIRAWLEFCLGKDVNTAQKLFEKGMAEGRFDGFALI